MGRSLNYALPYINVVSHGTHPARAWFGFAGGHVCVGMRRFLNDFLPPVWQATWGRGCKFGVGSDVAVAVARSEG